MPRPGGEADKLGNQFEAVWTVGFGSEPNS